MLRRLSLVVGFAITALFVCLATPSSTAAQSYQRVYGLCLAQGAGVQTVSSQCTFNVYNTGTVTPATIYSDNMGTVLTCPCAADLFGVWAFYFIPSGQNFDVRLSGGNPGLTPYTITDVPIQSGGLTSFSSGNLSPLFTTSVANPTTSPALSFALSTATLHDVFGTCTSTTPSYCPITNAMLTAPGSNTQLIWNNAGAFDGTSTATWDATNRAITLINATNNAFSVLSPGTLTLGGQTILTAPFLTANFGAFNIEGESGQDVEIGPQNNNTAIDISGTTAGQITFMLAGTAVQLRINSGTASAGMFDGPTITDGGAGTYNFILPQSVGVAGQYLTSQAGASGMTWTTPPLGYSCGTTTTCANSLQILRTFFGSVALSSGTPSTATVGSITPAFTSTSTYACTLTEGSTATNNLLKVVNTSSSSFTITGPNTTTDTIYYICSGY